MPKTIQIINAQFLPRTRPSALTYNERLGARSELLLWAVPKAQYLTLVDGRISALASRSGSGAVALQATTGARPLLDSDGAPYDRPSMVFDNTRNDRLGTTVVVPTGGTAKFTKVAFVNPAAETVSGTYHDIMSGSNTTGVSLGPHRLAVRGVNTFQARVGISGALASVTVPMTPDAWQLVISTWDGPANTLRISVNGGAWTSATVAGAQCDEAALNIGSVGSGTTFKGSIADAMFWDIDLSASANAAILADVKQYYRDAYRVSIS